MATVHLRDSEAESILPAEFPTDPYRFDDHIHLSLDQSVEFQRGYEPPFSGFGSSRSSSASATYSARPSEFSCSKYRELTRCMIPDDLHKLPSTRTSIIATHQQDPKFQENENNFNIIPKRVASEAAYWPQNIQFETPYSALTTPPLNHSQGMPIVKQRGPKFKQEIDQGHRNRRASGGGSNYGTSGSRHVSSASAWPPLQHPANSSSAGMRVMFLGGSNRTSKSSGTGVFLPPGIANSSESSRRKQGCSTVLIPAKVVQALKLHFDQVGGGLKSPPTSASGSAQYGGSIGQREEPQSSNRHPRTTTTMMPELPNQPEMSLPHDWTY